VRTTRLAFPLRGSSNFPGLLTRGTLSTFQPAQAEASYSFTYGDAFFIALDNTLDRLEILP
jgi:hypothetical protein